MGHGGGGGGIRTTWPGAILCKYSQVPTNPASNSFQGPGQEGEKRREKNHGSGPAGQAASNKSWGGTHRANKRWSFVACSLVFVPRFCASPLACNKRRTLLRCAGGGLDARVCQGVL